MESDLPDFFRQYRPVRDSNDMPVGSWRLHVHKVSPIVDQFLMIYDTDRQNVPVQQKSHRMQFRAPLSTLMIKKHTCGTYVRALPFYIVRFTYMYVSRVARM